MTYQRLLSYTRKAVDDYQMIQEGDRIAVGVSGGKDSITLALALKGLQRFYPHHFEVMAFTVSLGFPQFDTAPLEEFMRSYEIPYHVIPTDIGSIVFEERKESNPCSLCAKMRKGALNQSAKSFGCNTVAYAHHRDDIIETMLLSLIYEGRFHTFSPKTYLDRTELSVIRPLMYVTEAEVIGFKNKYQLPVCKNPCPADGRTKREFVKQLANQLNREAPGVKERLFHAVQAGGIDGWKEV